MNSRRYFANGIRGSAQRRDPRPLGGLQVQDADEDGRPFLGRRLSPTKSPR
jgi:hypothetical protein